MNLSQNLPHIIFADQATDVMRREAKAARPNEETGGILVGRRLDSRRILVIAATGPGPKAIHQQAMFSPDVDFANRELERLRQAYPGADLIGIWHKHPPNLDRPSPGDEQQVAEIFNDPDYAHLTELVTPIALVRNGQFDLKTYYTSRALVAGQQYFQAVERQLEFAEEAEGLLRMLPAPTGAWYTTPEVQARLQAEKQRLSQNFGAQLKEQQDEVYLTARSKRQEQTTVYFVLPPGFPHTPPTALLEYNGQEWSGAKSISLANWTPENSLARVAEELVSQLPGAKTPLPARRQPVPPPPSSAWGLEISVIAVMGGVVFLLLALLTVGGGYFVWASPGNGEPVAASTVSFVPVQESTATIPPSESASEPPSLPPPTATSIPTQIPTVITSTNSFTPTLTPTPTITPTMTTASTLTPSLTITSTRRVTVSIIADRLHVRKGPRTNYDSIFVLPEGEEVEVIGKNGNDTWLQIVYSPQKGDTGWICRSLTNLIEGELNKVEKTSNEIDKPKCLK